MTTTTASNADDRFERFYAEKLWALLPEIYRYEDGVAGNPGVLRALLQLVATEAAVARRSIDRLWLDQFIETCDDWAVPYIGDLVGTRLVHELNTRGRRTDVTKTIYYRRRNGTPVVIQDLIHDITGWDGVAVEAFRRLARYRHGLDPAPAGLAGPVTHTPPGGTADLREGRGCDLRDGPFDEYAHTPDMRGHAGWRGRWNINRVNVHVFRQRAEALESVTPFDHGDQRFTCDPTGRDTALFKPTQRADREQWSPPLEWEIEGPLACRLMNDDDPPDPPSSHLLPTVLAVAVGDDPAADPLERPEIAGAKLDAWGASLSIVDQVALVDPDTGRVVLRDPLAPDERLHLQLHHVGRFGETGAGTYDRIDSLASEVDAELRSGDAFPSSGTHELTTSETYELTVPGTGEVEVTADLTIQASDQQRPHVRIAPPAGSDTITLRGVPDGDDAPTLKLNGLWLGLTPDSITEESLADPDDPCTPVAAHLVLDGQFACVRIGHCTIDPGGERARLRPDRCFAIAEVVIEVRGQVGELIIDRSITGRIVEDTGSDDACAAATIRVYDSILSTLDPDSPALRTRTAAVTIERSTSLGGISVNRLSATETLVRGVVEAVDNQHGCFRFSAADEGSSLPPQFESHLIEGGVPNAWFVSQRYADPGYAQLTTTAPDTIVRGGENGAEIGAFNRDIPVIKLDDLEAKIREYLPFGLVPQFVLET